MTQLCFNYSCECLVNSKIPTSLFTKLESRLRRHLKSQLSTGKLSTNDADQLKFLGGDEVLAATIESLRITEDQQSTSSEAADSSTEYSNDAITSNAAPSTSNSNIFKVFLYKYPDDLSSPSITDQASLSTTTTTRTIDIDQQDCDSSSSNFYSTELFPCPAYQGLWESLEFDSAVKDSCLAYLTAVFRFTMNGMADHNEISFNRILLLHGPPGTGMIVHNSASYDPYLKRCYLGKTTLAKALVFKLSTRLYFLQRKSSEQSSPPPKSYDRLLCLTVHSNQLFSRFFSESSKAVQKLFDHIKRLASEPGNFVCVLIDEVESLAMSRKQSAEGGSSEPTDSIRVSSEL